MEAQLRALEAKCKCLEPSVEEFSSVCEVATNYCVGLLSLGQQKHQQQREDDSDDKKHQQKHQQQQTQLFSEFPEHINTTATASVSLKDRTGHLLKQLNDHAIICGSGEKDNNHSELDPRKSFGVADGGGVPSAAVADFTAALTNMFSGFYPAAPGLVLLEHQLVRWLSAETGFVVANHANDHNEHDDDDDDDDDNGVGGCFHSCASMATLGAIVSARDKHGVLPGSERYAKAVVYRTVRKTRSNNSGKRDPFLKALHLAGCGHVTVRQITIITTTTVEQQVGDALKKDVEDGLYPWLFVATAGDESSTGGVDPIDQIHNALLRQQKEQQQTAAVWLHIDGSYGAGFALCRHRRPSHFHCADSLIIDLHKALFLPRGSSVLLVRDVKQLQKSHTVTSASASYLVNFLNREQPLIHSSDLSPELSKHNRLLRMWLPLKLLGVGPFRAALEEKMVLAQYFCDKLKASQRDKMFEIIAPELSIVAFRLVAGDDDSSSATLNLFKTVKSRGVVTLGAPVALLPSGRVYLRVNVLNFRCHRRHMDELVDEIVACC